MKKKGSPTDPKLRLLRAVMIIKEGGSFADFQRALNPQGKAREAKEKSR